MRGPGLPIQEMLRGLLLAVLAILALAAPVAAQEKPAAKEPPYLISADALNYDEELGTITARGNVEIVQEKRILLADSVSYNQKTDTVSASGNVVLLEPGGEVLFANFVELTDKMKNGFIENIRLLMVDDSRFAANDARRTDGNRTLMRRAVYSPCDLCKENPDRPPLWQLKAERVVHDQKAQEVRYDNVFLEMWGVPVLYSPYFQHPDPTVKRRSGFLPPLFGTMGEVGEFLRVPYYIVVNDSIDVTAAPIYTQEEGLVMTGEYRQRFNKGEIAVSGSVTEAARFEGDPFNSTKKEEVRGHIDAFGRFDLDETWRTGFEIKRATDRTYLRRFDFFGLNTEFLTSNIYAEGFRGRNYFIAQGYDFQDLRTGDRPDQPLIVPLVDYSHIGEIDRFGGRWLLDGNLRGLRRDDGPDSQRISLRPGYEISRTADLGFVTTAAATLNADLYNIQQTDNPRVSPQSDDGVTGRLLPKLTGEVRYPFVREAGSIRQLIEPVAAVMVSPNGGNPRDIPNEDSAVFELDDTNLLSRDRFPGLDRVDSGQRFVYGTKLGVFGRGNGRTTAFIGQSYRLHTDHDLHNENFVEEDKSDLVGRLEIVPHEYVDLLYRFRFDEDDLSAKRNELSFNIGPKAFRLYGDYLFIESTAGTGGFPEREQLFAGFSSQITDYWSVNVSTLRDIAESRSLSHALGIVYADECFTFRSIFSRTFTRDADIQPSTSVLFQVVFKNLGQFETQTSLGGGSTRRTENGL